MHWLMKSEPGVYSLDDLERDRTTWWNGVRNYQARNYLRQMRRGDHALLQHSGAAPAIVGLMTVVRTAVADPGQFDPADEYYDPASTPLAPKWFQVEVRFDRRFPRPAALAELRADGRLKDMMLFRRGRLSVVPVTAAEYEAILRRCGGAPAGPRPPAGGGRPPRPA